MKTRAGRRATALALAFPIVAGCVIAATGAQQSGIPQLRKQGTATQLVVDGKPFLILGGELGNSSSSSLDYIRPQLCDAGAARAGDS